MLETNDWAQNLCLLAGFSPEESESYSKCRWDDLPSDVREKLIIFVITEKPLAGQV